MEQPQLEGEGQATQGGAAYALLEASVEYLRPSNHAFIVNSLVPRRCDAWIRCLT